MSKKSINVEVVARALCSSEGVNPDRLSSEIVRKMDSDQPITATRTAWHDRVGSAIAVIDAVCGELDIEAELVFNTDT